MQDTNVSKILPVLGCNFIGVCDEDLFSDSTIEV